MPRLCKSFDFNIKGFRPKMSDVFYNFIVLKLKERAVFILFLQHVQVLTFIYLIIISCDFNQVSKWFGTQYNLEVPL